jgi:DNA-binding NtrC family response regulator
MKPIVLLVDDEPSIQFGFSKYLEKSGYEVKPASSIAEAKDALLRGRYDVVILDLSLPDGSGLELIGEIRTSLPNAALVVITGGGDIPIAVQAMQQGADNFLTKPVDMNELDVYLKKSVELKKLRHGEFTRKVLDKKVEPFFGKSPAIRKVLEFASAAAGKDTATIIHGETGTGKGVLAKWIHEHSARSGEAFVEVNCSALKGDLLNSELFGHAKGAFTSAHQEKPGLLEVADGGTLFLDEIGDMDLGVQSQFLKVIEEKQYRRLGEVKTRHSDFRLICATNRDLLTETKQGRFRLDLYYRINVFPIYLPSLKERVGDLEEMVDYLLKSFNYQPPGILPVAMGALKAYNWPGNIRELKNVVERAIILANGKPLSSDHFAGLSDKSVEERNNIKGLDAAEGAHIKMMMEKNDNDTKVVSDILGISRPTLYRKLKKYNIPV